MEKTKKQSSGISFITFASCFGSSKNPSGSCSAMVCGFRSSPSAASVLLEAAAPLSKKSIKQTSVQVIPEGKVVEGVHAIHITLYKIIMEYSKWLIGHFQVKY